MFQVRPPYPLCPASLTFNLGPLRDYKYVFKLCMQLYNVPMWLITVEKMSQVRPPIPPGSSLAFIMQSMQPVRSRAEFPGRQRAVNNVSSLYRNLQAKEDQGQGGNNRRK